MQSRNIQLIRYVPFYLLALRFKSIKPISTSLQHNSKMRICHLVRSRTRPFWIEAIIWDAEPFLSCLMLFQSHSPLCPTYFRSFQTILRALVDILRRSFTEYSTIFQSVRCWFPKAHGFGRPWLWWSRKASWRVSFFFHESSLRPVFGLRKYQSEKKKLVLETCIPLYQSICRAQAVYVSITPVGGLWKTMQCLP